jgi:hypothetical protein
MRLLNPRVDRSIPAIASRSIPAIAIALCACSFTMSVHLVKPHRQPLPDTTQCAVLDLNDQPLINGESIGFLWNGYRQLTFADFKGRWDPASPPSIGSHSQCGIWGPEARLNSPPPGKALVYIIRPNRFTSSLPKRMLLNIFFVYPCPYLLFINAVRYQVDYAAAMTTDRIPAHRYVSLLLDPGERTFSPWATLGNWTYDSPDLDLLLAPGRTYYLRLDMPSRWFAFHARPRLVLISEEEGLRLLRKCRVARHEENDPPPLPPRKGIFG